MDIKLVYLIKAFLLPPLVFILISFLGVIRWKAPYGRTLVIIGLAGLIICSIPAFVQFMARQWETSQVLDYTQLRAFQPQAIVVLGGGIKKASPEYDTAYMLKPASYRRIRYAGKVARKTHLPVLVSGGIPLEKDRPSEADLMARVMEQELGIKARWLEKQSRNTAENALFSRAILKPLGIDRIILVTEAYHMPRAIEQFEANGFTVLPAPMDFISSADKPDLFSFIPTTKALRQCYLLTHEWLGYLWYRIRYSS